MNKIIYHFILTNMEENIYILKKKDIDLYACLSVYIKYLSNIINDIEKCNSKIPTLIYKESINDIIFEKFKNKNILILGNIFSIETINKITKICKNMLIVSNIKMELLEQENIIYMIEEEKSLSYILSYFFLQKIPLLIHYINKYTLNNKSLKVLQIIEGFKYIIINFKKNYLKCENINKLLDTSYFNNIIKKGKSIIKLYEYIMLKHLRDDIEYCSFPSSLIYNKFKDYYPDSNYYKIVLSSSLSVIPIDIVKYIIFQSIASKRMDILVIWKYSVNKKEYIMKFIPISNNIDINKILIPFKREKNTIILNKKDYDIDDIFENINLLTLTRH